MKPSISLITLGVSDFARSLDFYTNGLGWKKSSASVDDVAFFQLSGVAFALYPKDLLAKDAMIESLVSGDITEPSFSGITLSHNVASPEEVERVLAEAKSAGATITKPGEKTLWGGYSGYFSDPDGHLWEVAHNPFWQLEVDGRVKLPE